MPRTQRLKINDETTFYHEMSRTALDSFPLSDTDSGIIGSKEFVFTNYQRFAADQMHTTLDRFSGMLYSQFPHVAVS